MAEGVRVMRTVDKTKKSNIKCEHCCHFSAVGDFCLLKEIPRHYWNRCKEFKWRQE